MENKTPTSGKEMYSAEEFAHAIGIGRRTVEEHIRRGSIGSTFVGNLRRIPREEVDRVKAEGLKPLPAPKKSQKKK